MTPLLPPLRCALRPVHWLRWQALAALVFTLALGGHAAATPPVGAALKKFEEGVAAFSANNFAEALQLFQSSNDIEPSPNTRFKIAKSYLALGRIGSAYSNFRRTAKEAQDRINATNEQRFAPTKAAAEAEAAQLEAQVPRITLVLPTDLTPELAAELTISLDGTPLAPSILGSAIEVDAGPHRVNATGPHFTPFELGFEIALSEKKNLDIAVVRRKAGTLVLSFTKRPVGMAVAIDAQPVASNLIDSPITVGIGGHKIGVSAPGYLEFVVEKTLNDQETARVAVNLLPAPAPPGGLPKALTFVLGGTSLAFLGLGIGYGVAAQNTANDQLVLDPLFRSTTVRDGVRVNATIANAFFGISGAFAIATVVVAATTRWRAAPARPVKKVSRWLNPLPSLSTDFTGLATGGEP